MFSGNFIYYALQCSRYAPILPTFLTMILSVNALLEYFTTVLLGSGVFV